MAIPIPNPLVEFILLGPLDDRRQLQDSPILGDVWVEYGRKPSGRVDLLIAPYRGQHAGAVADAIWRRLEQGDDGDEANIAYLQGLVVASLTFEEVLRVVVPKTKWWGGKWDKPDDRPTNPTTPAPQGGGEHPAGMRPTHELSRYTVERVGKILTTILKSAKEWHQKVGAPVRENLSPVERFVALMGLILWAGGQDPPKRKVGGPAEQIEYVLKRLKVPDVVELIEPLRGAMLNEPPGEALVWQVSLNRVAVPALTRSVPAVKGDAAKTLFSVSCKDIAWAVIDSGIDGSHVAFRDAGETSRVRRSFDFRDFRKIVSLSNSKPAIRRRNLEALMQNRDRLKESLKPEEAEAALQKLADDDRRRGPIHWDLVRRFVEIKPEVPPASNHGTHVAGIIGASREAAIKHNNNKPSDDFADGMCPDISLFDFRVLGQDVRETEFAIIAALQFIRYLNGQDPILTIHGANLSLSIPHDVRNFACGRTPICDECERLVENGVVVVAAAGNHGYKSFETREGAYDSYAAFSITDPGNADSVITVGATHRFWPHTYGVSFFSSRGPTGDGRIKPDLVAPGERIRAPLFVRGSSPGTDWGDLDGTSMAAPHVSGAAAMLMARYSELIGQPRRIKRILCQTATDLGRERSFQGNGMLDVLRAFQSL